ncbi:unnamed protein product [Darwinula stevensoni]|uniref:GST C-terminal domain-containing protein n=1 Tax=Darwinula stevensoni TaxID=69355 RepID=A0A7R9AJ59_9CRUS|nr:unnamed protein product [Darwinula stevensoni]CAG0908216.1 unnamed protein product [Darwinula stevensoni]
MMQGPVMYKGAKSLDPDRKKSLEEALQWLDSFIQSSGGCCAADHLTIADYAIFPVLNCIQAMEVADLSAFGNIADWMEKCKAEMKGYEEIEEKVLPAIKQGFLFQLG